MNYNVQYPVKVLTTNPHNNIFHLHYDVSLLTTYLHTNNTEKSLTYVTFPIGKHSNTYPISPECYICTKNGVKTYYTEVIYTYVQ